MTGELRRRSVGTGALTETPAEETGNGIDNSALSPANILLEGDGNEAYETFLDEHPTNGSVPTPQPAPSSSPPAGTEDIRGRQGRRPRGLDVNWYSTKKTVAQGLMDLTLLTANANQLRNVLDAGKFIPHGGFYYTTITFICLSIIMQLGIGVALIFLGHYKVSHGEGDDDHDNKKAENLNNWLVVAVFLITVMNVFIASFAVNPTELQRQKQGSL